ncbi:HAD hydrolase family protein [Streptomyces sp. SID5643]|uniref:HAD hydrolase family protein n=1 Tax=Streptomyces sp. SID5643 TaxID=2690307 RepID=UPI00136A6C68
MPDLYADVTELHRGLVDSAERGNPLDAFLYAAGLVQVCEDHLAGTPWLLSRAAAQLDGTRTGTVLGRALNGAVTTTGLTPGTRRLRAWLPVPRQLTDALADAVTARPADAGNDRSGIPEPSVVLLERLGAQVPPPLTDLLRHSVLRPPSCFRSFDQHPRDIVALVRRFAGTHPDRNRPLLVIGVRTSGSYMAPLAGAALRAEGYARVTVRTTRPAGGTVRADAAALRRAGRDGTLALLIDDPPITGGSLVGVARALLRAGFSADRVVVLVAAFADRPVPAFLPGQPRIVLPPRSWHIRDLLGVAHLRRTLAALLPDQEVLGLKADEPGLPSRWSRLRVPLTARVRSGAGDRDVHMLAQGAGTGYFGRHTLAVAEALDGLVPRVHGFHDGVLLSERRFGENGLPPDLAATHQIPAGDVVRYVVQRRARVPLAADRSPLLRGCQPVWEIAARMFAGRCGRLGSPLRPLLVDPLVRDLLQTSSASLVDGQMTDGRWSPGPGGWTKADFNEGYFSHLDLAAYDAVYDLSGAAQARLDLENGLLAAYERLTDSRVPAARWCVYGVAHGWNTERLIHAGACAGPGEADARRARARAVQEFLAGLYLRDAPDAAATVPSDEAATGGWCALDVDGVLESDLSGAPASSPAGMLALRGLRAHGYHVLPATGRPVPELIDRCRAYDLQGGVAEYGALVYDAERNRCVPLVTGPDRAGLTRLLLELPSVSLDPQYQCCVRVSRGWGAGRRALDAGTVLQVASRPEADGFVVVQGETQTDFVPADVDKATGLAVLLDMLGAPEGTRPVLAVGDSAGDIPMLRWARHGFAPANAAPEVRAAGITVLRRPYQAGLADAVTRLLGHSPGRCPGCRAPSLSSADAALAALLGIPEAGRAGMPVRLARLLRARAAMAGKGSAG